MLAFWIMVTVCREKPGSREGVGGGRLGGSVCGCGDVGGGGGVVERFVEVVGD